MEIERKFLVDQLPNIDELSFQDIKQGYIGNIRVRLSNKSFITIKNKALLSRQEIEFRIPNFLARLLLPSKHIHKRRYKIPFKDKIWELDVFQNLDLIMVEVELESENELFTAPTWMGREVTFDEKYYNQNLIKQVEH